MTHGTCPPRSSSSPTSAGPRGGCLPPLWPQFPPLCNAVCPRFLPAPSLLVQGSKIHAFRKKWRVEPSPSLHRLGLAVCLPAPLPSFFDFYCCENNGGFWPLCIWVFPLASSADFLEAIAGGPGSSPSPRVVRLRLVGGATWGIPEAVQWKM